MLSFDCHPVYYNQNYVTPQRFGPLESLFGFSQHPSHCTPERHVRRYKPHHNQGYAQRPQRRTEPLFDLFSILEEPKSHKRKAFAKIFNGRDTFKIVVGNTTDYKTYSIHYRVSDKTSIIIESEEEQFQKIYSFKNGTVNLDNITWEVIDSSLIVYIPKLKSTVLSHHRQAPKEDTKPESDVHQPQVEEPEVEEPAEEQKKQVKRVEISSSQPTFVQKPKTQKPRVISIPIDFGDSEGEDATISRQSSLTASIHSNSEQQSESPYQSESEVRVESKVRKIVDQYESREQPSPKLPKLTRKVSIEEVEDESLQQMDLD